MFFRKVFSRFNTRVSCNGSLCFLLFAFCFLLGDLAAFAAQSPINAPTPAIQGGGSNNLTAFTGNAGALNNNNWNAAVNPGKGNPSADFGNCNAAILRCAQPKCASGGCTDMSVASAIANGCVQSNASCAPHGENLVSMIAAQLVAQSTAKANAQMAASQAAASENDANASAEAANQMQQMQMQMQQQMQQVQEQLARQAEESNARLESALAESRAQAAAAPSPAPDYLNGNSSQTTNVAAVSNGIPADVLIREQASGQILSKLEDVTKSMQTLKATMQTTFDYAGCNTNGDQCTGPKRVAAFKYKANQFFDPYNNVLDEVYDALIQAQALGVDITDIYMMLNDSCHVWGKYLCTGDQILRYSSRMGKTEGCVEDRAKGILCPDTEADRGKIVPQNKGGCQLLQMLTNNEEIQQNWLYPEQNGSGTSPCTSDELAKGNCIANKWDASGNVTGGYKINPNSTSGVQVACASEALDNSKFFRNRKKQSDLDIDFLQMWFNADAESKYEGGRTVYKTGYCNVDENGIDKLNRMASLKTFDKNFPFCINGGYGGGMLTHREAAGIGGGSTITRADCGKEGKGAIAWQNDACWCIEPNVYDTNATITNDTKEIVPNPDYGTTKDTWNWKKLSDKTLNEENCV
ncbi:MAG: hypothetical protein LBK26_04650 [Rickettsiales bacterium]|nr:hypothetical protein [Rickettsiales bacterium]